MLRETIPFNLEEPAFNNKTATSSVFFISISSVEHRHEKRHATYKYANQVSGPEVIKLFHAQLSSEHDFFLAHKCIQPLAFQLL